ncbi:hypothetical protein LCGC14_1353660 [marine sediment metagenome]|uniref:Uncharacterized protein n=1 Tax=marine sediment metagenome TaxID=412755 RepID=A0A0F9KAS1_9ZZZZ
MINKKFLLIPILFTILIPTTVFAYDLPTQFDEPCPMGQSIIQEVCVAVNDNHDAIHINIDDIATNATAIDILQGNVTTLSDRIGDNDIDITLLEDGTTILEGNVTSLDSRVNQNEIDITSIFSTITTILSDIIDLFSQDVIHTDRINSLNTTQITQQGEIDLLNIRHFSQEVRINSLNNTQIIQQSEIDTLESNVTVLQGNVADLSDRIDDNDTDISNLQLQDDKIINTLSFINFTQNLEMENQDITQSDIITLQGNITSLDARVIALEGAGDILYTKTQTIDARFTDGESFMVDGATNSYIISYVDGSATVKVHGDKVVQVNRTYEINIYHNENIIKTCTLTSLQPIDCETSSFSVDEWDDVAISYKRIGGTTDVSYKVNLDAYMKIIES